MEAAGRPVEGGQGGGAVGPAGREGAGDAGFSSSRFARALLEPLEPSVNNINAKVEEVRLQQQKLVRLVAEAKGELRWCSDLGATCDNGSLQATMDLAPHYAQKAQQCARDMALLRQRVLKAKEKASRLARAAEKKSARAKKAAASK